MDNLEAMEAPRDGVVAFQILFFLRFVQLGSTVLTGFIACYLVWWHDRLHDEIPSGLTIVICAVSFLLFQLSMLSHLIWTCFSNSTPCTISMTKHGVLVLIRLPRKLHQLRVCAF
jgi:hypothetical protein